MKWGGKNFRRHGLTSVWCVNLDEVAGFLTSEYGTEDYYCCTPSNAITQGKKKRTSTKPISYVKYISCPCSNSCSNSEKKEDETVGKQGEVPSSRVNGYWNIWCVLSDSRNSRTETLAPSCRLIRLLVPAFDAEDRICAWKGKSFGPFPTISFPLYLSAWMQEKPHHHSARSLRQTIFVRVAVYQLCFSSMNQGDEWNYLWC
jgi:hypothetical protein